MADNLRIIRLKFIRDNFYSPSTDEIIANKVPGINRESVSLIGYWNKESLNEPFIQNSIMQA